MQYYEHVPIDADDQTIACHPIIDQCNGSIAYRLLEHIGIPCAGKTALDLGAGTGQVSRFLSGMPGLDVEALDVDPRAEQHFRTHPELRDIPFHRRDFLLEDLPRHYDAIVCRGVFHHIPKHERSAFLRRVADRCNVLVLADEGIQEYRTEAERILNCESWYGYVITEAKRRGLTRLAEIESVFLEDERRASADEALDFKESLSHLLEDARSVGLTPYSVDRYGPWEQMRGGFFTVTFVK